MKVNRSNESRGKGVAAAMSAALFVAVLVPRAMGGEAGPADSATDKGSKATRLSAAERHYFSQLNPTMTAEQYLRHRAEARRGKDGPRDFGKASVPGNVVEGAPEVTRDSRDGGVQLGEAYDEAEILPKIRVDEPFPMAPLPIESAAKAFETVLAEVGATLPARDGHDRRYVRMTRSGSVTLPETQGFLRSIDQVGGFSEYEEYRVDPWPDADADGMPDDWERRHGLDPDDASDAAGDLNGDGYTNIEKYIHHIDPTRRVDWTNLDNNRDTLSGRQPGRSPGVVLPRR